MCIRMTSGAMLKHFLVGETCQERFYVQQQHHMYTSINAFCLLEKEKT